MLTLYKRHLWIAGLRDTTNDIPDDSRSDRLQGTLDLMVLRVLDLAPIHGYGVSPWQDQLPLPPVTSVTKAEELSSSQHQGHSETPPFGLGELIFFETGVRARAGEASWINHLRARLGSLSSTECLTLMRGLHWWWSRRKDIAAVCQESRGNLARQAPAERRSGGGRASAICL